MTNILVLLLLFSQIFKANAIVCKDGFTLVNNKCLMLFPIDTWSKYYFQFKCSSLGGNLVSIHTAIDNTAIQKLALSQGHFETIWIGLTCYGDNDPANCLWEDQLGNASSYNNFQQGIPQINNGSCVYMIPSTGKWVSGNCYKDSVSAICETDMIGACSYKFGDNCYYPITGQLHHDVALNICEQMCSGSLVSIHSPEENEYIRGLFIDSSITEIHVGAMLSTQGRNYWSDGSNWDYGNFNHSSINDGQCYTMSIEDGKWNSVNRNTFETQLPSICKWKASSSCRKTCTEPIYREETGAIYSPSYSYSYNEYRGISPCYYVLHVINGSAVIWFDNVNLDSNSSIELYSGIGNSIPISVITQENQNDNLLSIITSPSQLIKLVFNQCKESCDISQNFGWSAQFGTNYGARCGEILYSSGVITSQNYPNNYPNNYNCTYYLRNPGYRMQLLFNHFETEEDHDFVKIYDQDSGMLLWSLSGTYDVTDLLSEFQSLRIEFLTDGSTTFAGWSAMFYPW